MRKYILLSALIVLCLSSFQSLASETVSQEMFPLEQVDSLNTRSRLTRQYLAVASWYRHGTITASGERFNPMGLSVAHRNLPFGTILRITNPCNGSVVFARVNDRGPFIRGRDFDVSQGVAVRLNIIRTGVFPLLFEIM